MARTPKNPERAAIDRKLCIARQNAEYLIERLGISSAPVCPIEIALTEFQSLRLCPGNYKDAFDGLLEYHPSKGRFLCFYNTKYDPQIAEGHAPRTRFSLAHELGHYFIEDHHEYLRSGGKSHKSRSEFVSATPIEQQADCFAAHLLMPDPLVKPIVNQDELSIELISDIASTFHTSFVSAALRAVEVSHFYGAVVGIRDGSIVWSQRSEPLVDRGIYPGEKGIIRSKSGVEAWEAYGSGGRQLPAASGWARDWFRIYNKDLSDRLPVTESYLPARVMNTLIVILSIPEDELFEEDG